MIKQLSLAVSIVHFLKNLVCGKMLTRPYYIANYIAQPDFVFLRKTSRIRADDPREHKNVGLQNNSSDPTADCQSKVGKSNSCSSKSSNNCITHWPKDNLHQGGILQRQVANEVPHTPIFLLFPECFFVKTRHEVVGLVCQLRRPLGNAIC